MFSCPPRRTASPTILLLIIVHRLETFVVISSSILDVQRPLLAMPEQTDLNEIYNTLLMLLTISWY